MEIASSLAATANRHLASASFSSYVALVRELARDLEVGRSAEEQVARLRQADDEHRLIAA